jgi:hypothetical protein
VKTAGDHVEDARSVGNEELLREAGAAKPRLPPELAGVGAELAVRDPQQRRLAGAIATDQADALAGVELEARMVEQGLGSEGERDVCEAQQGLRALRGGGRETAV